MRNSNTFRDHMGGVIRHGWKVWCLAIVLLSLAIGALAADPHGDMSRYLRQRWGVERGLTGLPVHALAQTPDGYLWIGTEGSLLRFDGQSFQAAQLSDPTIGPINHVLALVVDDQGVMWVRMLGSRLLRYREGRFESVAPSLTYDSGYTSMSRAQGGGVILTGLGHGTVRTDDGGDPVRIGPKSPSVIVANTQTSDGRIWMGTRDMGLLYTDGKNLIQVDKGLPDRKVNCLLAVENGGLWIGTDNGLAFWDGSAIVKRPLPTSLTQGKILTLFRDRTGNLWVGTPRGLLRYNNDGAFWLQGKREDENNPVTAIFEDGAGNIWVGDSHGIEQLRSGVFSTYSSEDGLPGDHYGPVFVDNANRIWFAPLDGGLYWLRDGQTHRELGGGIGSDVVYSIAGADNEIWVGRQRGGLTHLHADNERFTATTYAGTNGLGQDSVYAVHRNRDGSVWAGTLTSGTTHLIAGRAIHYTSTDGLVSNTISAIEEGLDGTMWFGTPNGLSAFANQHWKSYSAAQGLPGSEITSLLDDGEGVLWIGTKEGLAYYSGSIHSIPTSAGSPLHAAVAGIAKDARGGIWISTDQSILRVSRRVLLSGHLRPEDIKQFAMADGLAATAGVNRDRSIAQDSRGRIWLTTALGLSVVDPSTVGNKAASAIAHLEGMTVDGKPMDITGVLSVSSAHQRLTFAYTGLNFAVPERVRFRYRLDGIDKAWSEPVETRQAIYSNLPPGNYRFRVIASNDGEWGGTEASMPVEITPQFWQSLQFRVAVVLALALIVVVLYQMRMRHLVKQVNMRFEERLAERTRIAQELHDTLLQGFFSASLQLHVAMDRIPASSAARPMLKHVLSMIDEVTEEARDAVRGLRSADTPMLSLQQVFASLVTAFPNAEGVRYQVIVEGSARPLDSWVYVEVCRIGSEAVANAFRHANAHAIDVTIEYASRHLRVHIRDNGEGIDPHVLRRGREGHWGLPGMRERAARIGGKLQLTSRKVAGTDVLLSVPAHIAYQSGSRRAGWGWLKRSFATRSRVEAHAYSQIEANPQDGLIADPQSGQISQEQEKLEQATENR